MGKSSSGRDRTGSEASSRSERRRGDDHDSSRRRSGADSMTSSSRRKSSRRNEYGDDGATFAPAITAEPAEISDRRRNGSRREGEPDDTRRRSSKSDRSSKEERYRGDVGDREDSRRDSRKFSKSDRKENTRALGDDNPSLPQNQFPGGFPETQPYRPPGLAAEYYGDHGESVQFQPGVRPNQPSIVTNAEQAHFMEPTVDAKPPPEPSSMGQIGAAAGYFGDANYDSDSGPQTTPSKPSQKPSSGLNKPPKHSYHGVSPRSSPGPQGSVPSFGQTPSAIGFAVPVAAAVGAAAEYYASGSGGGSTSAYQTQNRPSPSSQSGPASAYQTPNRPPPSSQPGSAPYSAPAGFGGSQHHSNAALYGGAAALAGAAAGAYISSHSHEHHSYSQDQTSNQASAFANGYPQPQGTQMHQAHRHKHKGLFGRFVDWWRDPEAIAQYEQYTEAIGYRRRRPSSGSRYGSTTRVDKTYRYSSDEERRKRSSATKKVVLGGMAGYAGAKVGEAMFKQDHDFDDTYSIKSGRPVNQSRVSFQDEPQYDRYGDVRLQRRDSGQRISTSERSSHKDKHHRRRSSSSSSNSSSRRTSRGAAMSAGAAAAGLAMGATVLDRKPRRRSKSRSRSPSSSKKYFSKRVSPMHSYVDLSTTNDGPGGLMGFFTSPSANVKKGKKPKGLFNFANESSSSSDADLRFGEGTVRRRASNRRLRERHGKRDRDHTNAAMMGLVAAGTALAAEADRRHEKGKRRHDADEYTGRTSRHASEHRISLDDHETGGRDDEWYDTDGDAESDASVDTALAYGGGVSAAQSRDSLPYDRKSSRPSYNFREEDQRRYYDSLGQAGYGTAPSFAVSSAQTAAVAGAAGAIGGWIASNAVGQDSKLPMGSLPPMRDLEPRPISDPPSKVVFPQITRISSTSVPLQQPQPIVPVTPFINEIDAQPIEPERQSSRKGRRESSDMRRPRRDSSPAKLPSQDPRISVNFSLAEEQLESERRGKDRENRRQGSSGEKDRRKSADAVLIDAASKPADASREATKTRGRRSSESTRRSSVADQRVADIERELEQLYEEHRQAEERKRKESALSKVTEGAVIGAAAAVAATALAGRDGKTGSGEEITPKRKSSLKKTRERETSPPSETQQERIARMAAQRVRSTPSPVQHDSYGSFFVPAELREHLKEHNNKSEQDDVGATVVEIVPGASKSHRSHLFDPYTYRQFGLELDDDPTLYPWPVPMLGLIEPTPPGSQTHSVRGDETPIVEPKVAEPPGDIGEPLERRESKVTFGDYDTYVYEVQTPEYERSDYVPDSLAQEEKFRDIPSPDEVLNQASPIAEEIRPRPGVGRTWTLDEAEADKLEKEVLVVDDRPQISRAWTVDNKEADQIEHEVPEAPPSDEATRSEISPQIIEADPKYHPEAVPAIVAEPEGLPEEPSPHEQDGSARTQALYQSPFAENVSDLGVMGDYHTAALSEAKIPTTIAEEERHAEQDHDRIENEAEPQVPETSPSARMSKSEQRRRERASSSVQVVRRSVSEQGVPELERDIVTPPPIPDTDSVFDYMVDDKGYTVPSASILGLGASAVLAADQMAKAKDQREDVKSREPAEEVDQPLRPKRRSTYDDSRSQRPRSGSKAEYQSDPEEWERSTDKKSRKSKSSSKSDVGAKTSSRSKDRRTVDEAAFEPLRRSRTEDDLDEDKSSRRGSRHGNRDLDDESTTSRKSRDQEKKSRSRRSREADGYRDDDSRSIASSGADSKGKAKESGGFFSSLFSSNKSDVSTSSKKSSKSSKSDSRADRERDDGSESRKKRRSRDKADVDDVASPVSEPTRRSRRNSDPQSGGVDQNKISRDQSIDDGFVSAEEIAEMPVNDIEEGQSFLGSRPEMPEPTVMNIPMGTDGVSGPTSEREPSISPDTVVNEAGSPRPDSSPALPQLAELRRLSAIRTNDVPSSPITTSSPTAVPLQFRRPPMSPTNPRFTMSSPGAAPSSPLTTPRTRQGRPKSTEFRSSKEFRPLYLVERRNFAKTAAPEPDEDLPSLPSSKTSSANTSMEDLRAEAQAQDQSEYFTPSRISAEMFRERGRRHSYSYWHDDEKRRESPDYLDSRSATPMPSEAQRAREREKKPKPKYEFHSPSELLQDPGLLHDLPSVDDEDTPESPLPSVASTDLDQDYMSARSRSLSPTRTRSLSRGRRSASTTRSTSASWQDALTTAAAGVLAGSALGIAAHEVFKERPEDVSTREVETPTKSRFCLEEISSSESEPKSIDIHEDRGAPVPSPTAEPQTRQQTVEPQPGAEPQSTAKTMRDSGAWKNIFAEIHKRQRGLNDASEPSRIVVVEQVESESLKQYGTTEAPLPTSTDAVPLAEKAEDRPNELAEPQDRQAEQDFQQQFQDAEELALEPSGRSKKSKKDKTSKKKQATLTFDEDLPPTPEEKGMADNSQADQEALSSSAPTISEFIPSVMDNSFQTATDVQPTQAVLLEGLDAPPTASEDKSKATDKLIIDQTSTSEKALEPQGDGLAEIQASFSPLEEAFEAAIQARGLTEGATVEEAYQSFQPEIPDVGGTQLTTIREESELPTPAMEQEPKSIGSEALVERKSSKKDKRKQEKAKKALFDDFAEAQATPAQGDDTLKPASDQPQDFAEAERSLSKEECLTEPTLAQERPNPFGDDFYIKPEEIDLPSVDAEPQPDVSAIEGAAVHATPREEADSSMATSKKGKKNKKKTKRQSYNWEEEPMAEQAEPDKDLQAAEPDAQAISEKATTAEAASVLPPDAASEERMFVTPVETPQQESVDPWEMSSKSGKKKSKSKKRSLAVSFEDVLAPASEEPPPVMASPSESSPSTYEALDSSSQSKEAMFVGQVVEEPATDELVAPTPESSAPQSFEEKPQSIPIHSPVPVAASVDGESKEPHFSESVNAGQVVAPRPDEKLDKDRAIGIAAAVGETGAAALLAMDHHIIEILEPVDAESKVKDLNGTSRDMIPLEETAGFAQKVNDVDIEDTTTHPVPEVGGGQDKAVTEQFKTGAATTSAVPEEVAAQASASVEEEHTENALPAPTPSETPSDTKTTVEEPPSQQDEDFFPIPTKKSKKDKKKKPSATFDDNEVTIPVQEPAFADETVTEPESAPPAEDKSEAEMPIVSGSTEALIPEAPTPGKDAPQQKDGFFSIPAKKSKKDKKKRESAFDNSEVPTLYQDAQVADNTTIESAIAQVSEPTKMPEVPETPTAEPEASSALAQDASQQDEDCFPMRAKKSKKDKKKKRGSTLTFDETDIAPLAQETQTAEDNVVEPSVAEDVKTEMTRPLEAAEALPESITTTAEEVPQEADDQGFMTKSKKSKDKKKRRILLDDFDDILGSATADQGKELKETTPTTIQEQTTEPEGSTRDAREAPDSLETADPSMTNATNEENAQISDLQQISVPTIEAAHGITDTRETLDVAVDRESPTRDMPSTDGTQRTNPTLEDTPFEQLVDEAFTETPAVGPSTVEPSIFEAPAVKAPVDEDVAAETPAVEPPVVETSVAENPAAESSAVEISAHETVAVEAPTVETPIVETPVVETLANEDLPAIPGGFEPPTEEEWRFSVQKPKKDKKKKRQSALAADSVGAEPSTSNIQEAMEEPKPTADVYDITGRETTLPEGGVSNLNAQDFAEDDGAPTPPKSKKDKKKKKRQSTLAANVIDLEEAAQDSKFVGPEASTTYLETMTGEPQAASEEATETQENTIPESKTTNPEEVIQAIPDDEWGFTSGKSKKDKGKKKRQSAVESVAFEPATDVPSEAEPTAEHYREASVAVNAQTTEPAEEVGGESGLATPDDQAEDPWAPAPKKKKDKKKGRRSKLDELSTSVNEEPGKSRDVGLDEAQPVDTRFDKEVTEQNADVSEHRGIANQHSSPLAERTEIVVVPDVGEGAWMSHPEQPTMGPPPPQQVDEVEKMQVHSKLATAGDVQEPLGSENPSMLEETVQHAENRQEDLALCDTVDAALEDQGFEDFGPFWKKSKKNKKKSRQSVLEESEPTEAVETTLEREDPFQTLTESAEPVADEQWLTSTKTKSRESKKKRQSTFDDAFADPTPVTPEAKLARDEGESEAVPKDIPAGRGMMETTEQAEEQDWNIPKIKEEKKKKRQSAFDDVFAEPARVIQEPKSILEQDVSEPQQELTLEPNSVDTIPDQAQPDEENWNVPKKSKKDKKKKRQSTFTDIVEDPVSADDTIRTLMATKSEELSDKGVNPGIAEDSVAVEDVRVEPPPTTMDIVQPQIQDAPASDVPIAMEGEEQQTREEPRPDLPMTLLDEQPKFTESAVSDTPMMEGEEPQIEEERQLEPQKEVQEKQPQVLPTAEEDVWAPKSKKGKKKRHQSTFDETDLEPPQSETAEPESNVRAVDSMILAEPPMPSTADQIFAEPLATEPIVDDELAVSSKKSKKGKKTKRQSTLHETTFESPQTEIAEPITRVEEAGQEVFAEPTTLDTADGPQVDAPTTEPVVDEEWATSSKKSKRDKKKRRTLLAENNMDESQPATPVEARPVEEATVVEQQLEAEAMAKSIEEASPAFDIHVIAGQPAEVFARSIDEENPETAILSTSDHHEIAPPTTEPPPVEDGRAVPTKKSEKDKKKKKQKATLDDIQMDESLPETLAEAPLVEEPAVDEMQHETEIAAKNEAPENSVDGSMHAQPVMVEDIEQAPKGPLKQFEHPVSLSAAGAMDIVPEQSMPSLRDYPVQEPELDHVAQEATVEGMRELVATVDEPATIEADGPLVKKSKKEKRKSKRQSTFDDSLAEPRDTAIKILEEPKMEDAVDAPRTADGIADDQQPTAETAPGEIQPEDEWTFSALSTKKSKKKSKKTKALTTGDDLETPGTETPKSTDQFESAAETPMERTVSPEPMEDVEAEEPAAALPKATIEDYLTPGKKKSKKDKKRKSSLTWTGSDDQPTEDASATVSPTPLVKPEPSRDQWTPDEWKESTLAAHQDTSMSLRSESHIEEPRREMQTDPTQVGAGVGETPRNMDAPIPPNDSENTASEPQEYKLTFEPSRPSDLHVPQDIMIPTEDQPMVITTHEGAVMSRDFDVDSAVPETTLSPSEEELPKRKKSKKDRKAKKERRVFEFDSTENVGPSVVEPESETRELDVMETIPEGMEPSPTPVAIQEPKVTEDGENLSDVSESTRERRRRRRSPPAWSGEEPEDLPRDRALTPPPEHDDIMDTALVVAAGLGFDGRETDSAREPPPKPPSPARQPSTGWSFAKLRPVADIVHSESNRDSGVQFESPVLSTSQFSSTRDSGFIPSPAAAHSEFSASKDDGLEMKLRPPRPQSPTSSTEDVSKPVKNRTPHEEQAMLETPRRKPSPVESTTKDRSSVLFNSSPAVLSPLITTGTTRSPEPIKSPLHRSPSIHGHHHSREELRQQKAKVVPHHEDSDQLASSLIDRSTAVPVNRSAFDPEFHERSFTPGRTSLTAIREDSTEISPKAHPFAEPRVVLTPQHHNGNDISTAGLVAAAGAGLAAAALATRDAGAKSLGRSKSRTSSLRNLRGNSTSPYDPANFASGSSQEPVNARDTGKSTVRDRDMADVYDGYGSYPGSPKSPTRPPSVRRRQSMQQIKDLEARLDQLANENRALAEAKIVTEQHLEQAHFEHNRSENAMSAFNTQLQERDAEIARLREEVASLVAIHDSLKREHEQSLFTIRHEHDQEQSQWQDSSRELETLRSRHNELSTGMETIVRQEIDLALTEKNLELQRLRGDLEVAREKIRELQSRILERPADDVAVFHDEDYFDQACQKLCQQVQGWVLRFSKFSDLKLCRSTNEVRDEKIVDRFDNAILDGSDVDNYLADRVKRRDVFMSVVMTMIWEYVFTRYLFGMDREQRQKLKQLEKNLGEVGALSAVHQWRALTLTLLSKRESFKAQRESDTEAVAIEIFSTLSRFLPPPQNLEEQIVGSLRNVMRTAVELSIEMRTQRAEYIMLPPLQPEYDTNGDLARKVYFNAGLMNERSGETTSNEELQRDQAVVRMVLFPLVVKKGDDNGVGDDEFVVCPAQVLIARPDKGKKPRSSTRHASGGSDAKSLRAISSHSLAMSGIEGNENMF